MKRKIKIDYFGADLNTSIKMTGVKKYFNEIYKRIETDIDGKKIEYKIYNLPFFKYTISSKLNYLGFIKERRKDSIVHFISQNDAIALNFLHIKRTVVTCHDLIKYIYKEHSSLDKIWITSLRKTDCIISVSHSTEMDLIRYLDIPPEKIHVIYNGVGDEFTPVCISPENCIFLKYPVLNKYNNKKLILYVGTEESRKNIEVILKAIFKLKVEFNQNVNFIKIGKPGWKDSRQKLNNLVNYLKLTKEVFFIDYVDNDELKTIYNIVDVFVYPSLYEGFGLPTLEAMACGTPVITSNISSLPEVVGDAGIMINPYDVDGLAKAMYDVLTNDGLKEDMRKKGLERAKLFSWDKAARETLKVYEEVYSKEIKHEASFNK